MSKQRKHQRQQRKPTNDLRHNRINLSFTDQEFDRLYLQSKRLHYSVGRTAKALIINGLDEFDRLRTKG